MMQLFATQMTLKSALCSVQRELPTLIRLVGNRRLAPEQLVSHHFALRDGAAAYQAFADRKPGTRKMVFTVDD
jgi:threonine dehydrogenase-like Zn-dependent dehydrogenase